RAGRPGAQLAELSDRAALGRPGDAQCSHGSPACDGNSDQARRHGLPSRAALCSQRCGTAEHRAARRPHVAAAAGSGGRSCPAGSRVGCARSRNHQAETVSPQTKRALLICARLAVTLGAAWLVAGNIDWTVLVGSLARADPLVLALAAVVL